MPSRSPTDNRPSPATTRLAGIDFSGAATAGKTMWLAEGSWQGGRLVLERCRPVRDLPGGASRRDAALRALVDYITGLGNCLIGCDFPFTLPHEAMPTADWREFVLGFGERWPNAESFRTTCRQATGGRELKRPSEIAAKAPFATYNLRLFRQTYFGIRDVLAPLIRSESASVVPFMPRRADTPCLLEVCPATYLRRLCAPAQTPSYKGISAARQQARKALLAKLEAGRLIIDEKLRARLLGDPRGDALDSVIAAVIAGEASDVPACLTAAPEATGAGDGRIFPLP